MCQTEKPAINFKSRWDRKFSQIYFTFIFLFVISDLVFYGVDFLGSFPAFCLETHSIIFWNICLFVKSYAKYELGKQKIDFPKLWIFFNFYKCISSRSGPVHINRFCSFQKFHPFPHLYDRHIEKLREILFSSIQLSQLFGSNSISR